MILNNTSNFLMFENKTSEEGIAVKVYEENLWLTQKAMSRLYGVAVNTISEHLKNIFITEELNENSVVRNFRTTASDGKEYNINFYNLDAIISVGYRVNSKQAIEFRKWSTNVLKKFAIEGYVIDKERMKNGNFLDKDYFDKLLEEIKEIRASERRFYQKITDIYATSVDYNKESFQSKDFYANVQNKLHYAITGNTAAELIEHRANSDKQNMGLTSWEKSPDGKILKRDVTVAKNYYTEDELKELNNIVNMFLDYAENQARRQKAMTMEGWSKKLDSFLQFNEYDILKNLGQISKKVADETAVKEYEKFKVTQDELFKSDFDKLVEESKKNTED
jgi:hypothetical protein